MCMLHHNQSTRSHDVKYQGAYAVNADTHFERAEENVDAPTNVAEVFSHTRENAAEQEHKEHVGNPEQCGPCGSRPVTVASVVKKALVWRSDAEPHSTGLTKGYFRAY